MSKLTEVLEQLRDGVWAASKEHAALVDEALSLAREAEERIEALLKLVSSFDAAIQHIAAPLGIACGGVDTVDNINPETGEPFGPGGHTGVEESPYQSGAPYSDIE